MKVNRILGLLLGAFFATATLAAAETAVNTNAAQKVSAEKRKHGSSKRKHGSSKSHSKSKNCDCKRFARKKCDPFVGAYTVEFCSQQSESTFYGNAVVHGDGTVEIFTSSALDPNYPTTAYTGVWKKVGKCTYRITATNVVASVFCGIIDESENNDGSCGCLEPYGRGEFCAEICFDEGCCRARGYAGLTLYSLRDMECSESTEGPFTYSLTIQRLKHA